MFDIAVVGTATEDVFVTVPASKIITIADPDDQRPYLALEYGGKLTVNSIFISVGGGSTNTAAGLARMGLRTMALARLGRDEAGDRVLHRLRGLGINTDCFIRTDDNFTGLSVILTGFTGDRTILTYRGASAELTADEINWEALAAAPWMYVGSMSGDSAPLFVKLAEFAGERGIQLALNPGGTQLKQGLAGLAPALRHCTALFLNRREGYQLTGVEPRRGDEDENEVLDHLHATGCRWVFLTLGAEGVIASDGEQRCRLPAYRTRPVSTVGAGDSFAAGALTALIKGEGLERAAQVGALNGASVVQQFGATTGLLTWQDALRYLESCRPGDPCPIQPSPEPYGVGIPPDPHD